MSVVVSGDNTVSVSIVDGPAIAVDVAQTSQSGVDAYGGIGPTVVVTGSATSVVGVAGVNPFVAGPNITITTTGGNITVIGEDPQTPDTIESAIGGTLVTLNDDIDYLDEKIDVVGNRLPPLSPWPASGVPIVAGASGTLRTATSYVASVMGRTGTVTLTLTDIVGAGGARSALTGGSIASPDVSLVLGSFSLWDDSQQTAWISADQGQVFVDGNYKSSLISAMGAAADSHSHGAVSSSGSVGTTSGRVLVTTTGGAITATIAISTAQISNFSTAASLASPVASVNGKTGAVTVTQYDIASEFGNDDLRGDLAEMQAITGSLEQKFPQGYVPAGKGLVSSYDAPGGVFAIRSSSGFVHTLNGCTGTVTIMAGPNITITPNASLSRITISSTGGGSGGPATGVAIWPSIIFGG